MQTHLKTSRLLLRPPQLEDAPDLFNRYAGRAEVVKPFSFDVHQDLEDTRNFIRHCQNQWKNPRGPFEWAIEFPPRGAVGMISLRPDLEYSMLGYILGPDFWNQGITTEAARAVRDAAFLELHLPHLRAFHFPGNTASGRIMDKIGMSKIGAVDADEIDRVSDGQTDHVVLYELTLDQWLHGQRG